MKKKLIHSSVLTALLSVSSIALAGGPEIIIPEPDYFSGFYVGGIGGVHHNTYNGNSTVNAAQNIVFQPIFPLFPSPPPVILYGAGTINSTDTSGGGYNGYGGVQGGFGKVFNHQFYIGLQGWGDWGSTSNTETNTAVAPLASFTAGGIILPAVTVSPSASATTSTTTKISNDYGIAGKLGWVVAPRSMVYGKIGASWATINVSNSVNAQSGISVNTLPANANIFNSSTTLTGSSSSGDQNKVGLLLGVGFEQFVYQDIVSLNVEADYTNYGHVDTTPGEVTGSTVFNFPAISFTQTFLRNSTNVFTSANASSIQVTQLMAGINFYFGRDWF